MYACLTSSLPFAVDPELAKEAILNGFPELFEGERLEESEECCGLLDWMLAPDPERRPSAVQAMEHEWFSDLWVSDGCEVASTVGGGWELLAY
jgi:serine/threonine protein kinase